MGALGWGLCLLYQPSFLCILCREADWPSSSPRPSPVAAGFVVSAPRACHFPIWSLKQNTWLNSQRQEQEWDLSYEKKQGLGWKERRRAA